MTNAFTDQPALDMDQLRTEVAKVVLSLTDINRRSEPEFVRLGDELQKVMDKVQYTHGEISQALDLIQRDHDGGILFKISTFETEISIRFDTNAETIQFCLDRMNDSIMQLRDLDTMNFRFAESVARMNAIGIYFAIEIARSPMAFQVFSTFAADIRSLFGEICCAFEQVAHETTKNVKIQESALNSVNQDRAELTSDVREMIKKSTDTINQISMMSAETLERITKYFSLLEINVARILTAIQVGDITRQQIEHVIEALASASPCPTPDGRPDVEWCRLVSLQFAQLRHVRTEFTDARATVQEALEQIATALGILAADVDDLLSGARTATGAADWVAELTGELQKMWNLETKTSTIFAHTLETMDMVTDALSQLQHHVHQIGDNNRRLSLEAYNARILSMRLGAEGRALTTLAKEVSDLSQSTKGFTGTVACAIGAIVAIAGQAGARIQSAREAQGVDDGTKANSSCSVIDLLGSETREFVRLTSEACSKARSLQADMEGIKKALQAIDGVQLQLEKTLAALGSVAMTLSSSSGETFISECNTNQLHAERYTMETERLIHRQLASGHEVTTSNIASSMTVRRDMVVKDDQLGENVELF
ncbi:MAG: hypothetical protein HQL37_09135 [Alphaproteobacteria bacterium]|nr:hypothetical protein [Alphaproteobacteria bacterium]